MGAAHGQMGHMEKLFTDQRQLVMARYPSLAADHLAQSANAERTGYLYKQGSAIAHSLALVVGDTPTSPDRLVVRRGQVDSIADGGKSVGLFWSTISSSTTLLLPYVMPSVSVCGGKETRQTSKRVRARVLTNAVAALCGRCRARRQRASSD